MNGSSLASRAIKGVRWNYIGAVGRILATFISQIALARMLGPETFGVFGYAVLTVSLLALVVEMGLASALVQTATLDEATLASACARLLLAGTIGSIGVFLGAEAIAVHVLDAPEAVDVLRAMSPTLLVGALTAVATAMSARELNFRNIQVAALGSYVIGYLIVGIGAAAMGLGVWSLVLAWHVQTVLACAVLLRRSPRKLWPGHPLRRLVVDRYANVTLATHVTNWIIDNGPHVAVGRWLDAHMLGLYTIANNLVKVPADHLARNVQSVLHSLASRTQDNDARLKRAYLTVIAGIGVAAFPTFVYVATMADAVVDLLLGAKWTAAAPVLVPLSLAMALHAVEAMAGPTLSGRGEPELELRIKIGTLVVMLSLLVVAARSSLLAVAWCVAGVFLLRWLAMHAMVARRLDISHAAFFTAIRGPLILGALAWGVPSALQLALEATGSPVPDGGWMIVLTAVPTALVIVMTALVAPWWVLGPHLLAMLAGVFTQRPALAARPGLGRLVASAERAALAQAGQPPSSGASSPWTRQPKTSP